MKQKKIRRPGYLHHKSSGRAYVLLGGQFVYLGDYDSEDSHEEYNRVVNQWMSEQEFIFPADLTISILALKYLKFCDKYYLKDGLPTTEPESIRISLRYLIEHCGDSRADKFGPLKLKEVRKDMIAAQCVRKSINCMVGRIKRMWKWAASEELVDAKIWHALRTVDGLRAEQEGAIESERIQPVAADAVNAIKNFVSRQIWAMVRLQHLSGARPGEMCVIRTCDIDRSGAVWEYRPHRHKTQHHGRERIVFFGPKSQALLAEWLRPDTPEAYLFSPAEAKAEFHANRKNARTTPMTPSQAARTPKVKGKRQPGLRYTIYSYGHAIRKACEKAFDMPEELRTIPLNVEQDRRSELLASAAAWRAVHCWHPNQLRHTRGTEIRSEFGLEESQVVLGHAKADVTQIYADRDNEKARQVMAHMG